MTLLRRLAVLVAFLAAVPAWGQAGGDRLSADAFLDRDAVPAGATARVALRLTIVDGYHVQSARPLDADFIPTAVKSGDVPGVVISPPRYPAHELIDAPSLTTGGQLAAYEGTVYVLLPLRVAADAAVGERTLTFTVTSQACNDRSCEPPHKLKVSVPLRIVAAGAVSPPAHADVFAAADAQAFMDAKPAAPLNGPPVNGAPATAPSAPASIAPGVTPPGPTLAAPAAGAAAGVDDLAAIRQRDYRPAAAEATGESLWKLALFALGGGAVLNVMPCVLPVVPLKVLTLVQQAHGRRSVALLHAAVFAAGIVTLFLVLAAAAGAFRAFGVQVMYGQQFQSPLFLLGMGYVVLALALSMLGVWTVNPPQAVYAVDTARGGLTGSFMMGLLATLLATPCSAPLLGPVLAWALVRPVWLTMLVFALVGLGMAVPYVLLAAFPTLLNRLPKTGRWTELLKQFLGLVMVGVAVYLLLQMPVGVLPWGMTGALVVAVVCWAWGQIPTLAMSMTRVWAIRGVAVALGLGLGVGLYRFASRAGLDGGEWRPFNVAELDSALQSGRPVLVDFTASWCINCKFVEATVLQSPQVRKPLADKNALLLRADLTSDNPAAQALLEKLDARSIPVLAVFKPAAPLTPAVLRDIYTKDRLLGALGG